MSGAGKTTSMYSHNISGSAWHTGWIDLKVYPCRLHCRPRKGLQGLEGRHSGRQRSERTVPECSFDAVVLTTCFREIDRWTPS